MTETAPAAVEPSPSSIGNGGETAGTDYKKNYASGSFIIRDFHLIALVVMMLVTVTYLVAVVLWIIYDDTLRALLKAQVRTVLGLPLSAIAGFCLVVVLEEQSGPVEIGGFGLKFRGAAGPVVLWIFCTLALVASINILWR